MRIARTFSELRQYARRPRVAPGRIASQASCFILNTVKATEAQARRIDNAVREVVWSAYARGIKDKP